MRFDVVLPTRISAHAVQRRPVLALPPSDFAGETGDRWLRKETHLPSNHVWGS
ncbi:MAG: hypothetical protein ACRDTF_23580 [Pseudonocardiaceae bacterium]